MTDGHVTREPRRAAVVFIFATVALVVLAFGVVIPVLPKLLEQFSGGDTANAARSVTRATAGQGLIRNMTVYPPEPSAPTPTWLRRYAVMNSSISPSKTAPVSLVSASVRRSFTILYGWST